MIRGLILLIVLLFTFAQAQAFEIILPAEKKSIVNTQYAFFVGKATGNETISINDENVYVAPNGAFAHTIKLKDGENRVLIRSQYGRQFYKFYKNKSIPPQEFPTEELDIFKAVVNCDNTPLRNTPIDGGLNRIGHLFAGTELLINGAQNGFYRVFLSENKIAWVAKKDVTVCENSVITPAEFIDMKTERFKNASIQTIEFTKKLPYTIEDNEKEIILRIFNPELSPDSVYNLNIPKPKKYTYKLTIDGGKYTFKVRKLPEDIRELTIAIDAGHGGSERGAIGCLGDEEKVINLNIAQRLSEILCKAGANVVMTRECDAFVSLDDRVKFAKENDADIFVSVHLNSIGDVPMDVHKTRGTSVYYFNANSQGLAQAVKKSVVKHAKTRDAGVKTASFAVIRPSDYIGILVETAYMTNPLDSVLYTSDDFLQKAAEGIAEGILEYIHK